MANYCITEGAKHGILWQPPRGDAVAGGSKFQEGTYVYLWQKPTQHCKAIILQLKRNFKKTKLEDPMFEKQDILNKNVSL